MAGLSNGPIPDPPHHLTPKPVVWKVPFSFRFQPNGRRSRNTSIGHIWEHNGWLRSDAMNNCQLLLKPQMNECRSNTKCSVVKRPDHHCGYDLVSLFTVHSPILVHYVCTFIKLETSLCLEKCLDIHSEFGVPSVKIQANEPLLPTLSASESQIEFINLSFSRVVTKFRNNVKSVL